MKKLNKLAVLSVVSAILILLNVSLVLASKTGPYRIITGYEPTYEDTTYNDYLNTDTGGGVFYVKGGTLTVRNVTFSSNTSTYYGGAINNESKLIIKENVVFSSNTAKNYGGALSNYKSGSSITVGSGTLFVLNTAGGGGGGGGAIFNNKNCNMIIEDGVVFLNNKSGFNGGAILNEKNAIMTIGSNAQFISNTSNSGGAIINDGTITFKDGAIFRKNSANEAGAINNSTNGTLNLIADTKDVLFIGNYNSEGSNAIYNQGIINLWAGNAEIIFNDRIKGGSGSQININQSSETLPTTGKIVLNEDMSRYVGKVTIYGGTLQLGQRGTWFGGDLTVWNSPTINLANGFVQEHNFNTLTIVAGTLNLAIDADLANKEMDTISATSYPHIGNIKVNSITLISDADGTTTIPFTDSDILKNKITSIDSVSSLLYKYAVKYNDDTGCFEFTNLGTSGGFVVNPVTAASAIAGSVGGYATQSVVINQAFAGIDRQSAQKVQPKTIVPQSTTNKQQTDKKQPVKTNGEQNKKSVNINSSNLYVSAGNQIFDDSGKIERSLWLRPFALQETIKLNGVDIDNTLYGTLAGIDFIANQDSSIMLSFYLGYAGSKQKFDDVKTDQTGYIVGLTGTMVKNNYYVAITLNEIFNKVESQSSFGTDDFNMNMFTIGAKAGYNYNINEKWTLEPNLTLMYGIANSDSYETSQGAKIDSQNTNNILLEPQIKAKLQLTNGWQPYGLLGYAANLSGKPKVKAGGQELELDSIDGFVEYGIGVNKEFIGSVWSCYGQITGRSGGRNGFGGNFGIKYKF